MKTTLLKVLPILFVLSLLLTSCGKNDPVVDVGNCTDGIQNNGETGIDCGGTCVDCASVCADLLTLISNAAVVYSNNQTQNNCILYRDALQASIDQQCDANGAYQQIVNALSC